MRLGPVTSTTLLPMGLVVSVDIHGTPGVHLAPGHQVSWDDQRFIKVRGVKFWAQLECLDILVDRATVPPKLGTVVSTETEAASS